MARFKASIRIWIGCVIVGLVFGAPPASGALKAYTIPGPPVHSAIDFDPPEPETSGLWHCESDHNGVGCGVWLQDAALVENQPEMWWEGRFVPDSGRGTWVMSSGTDGPSEYLVFGWWCDLAKEYCFPYEETSGGIYDTAHILMATQLDYEWGGMSTHFWIRWVDG